MDDEKKTKKQLVDELTVLRQRVAEFEGGRVEHNRAEEQLYFQSSVVDNAPDAIIAMDANEMIKSWNAAAEVLYGWSAQEVVGYPLREFLRDEYVGITGEEVDRQLAETGIWRGELFQVPRDGVKIPVQASVALVKDRLGKPVGYVAINRDVSERRQAEGALKRANRGLRVLSKSNAAVGYANDETELLNAICQIAVEEGGYRMAWVGYVEHDRKKSVRLMAHKGFEAGYLSTVNITWADTKRGQGPTGIAIRSGKPCLARDIPGDPNYEPWRAAATKRGYHSSIALPLIINGQTLGTLNIYAAETDAFDEAEITLLTEVADNLAYGIATLRNRIERKQVEVALRQHERQLALIYDTVGDVLYQLQVEGPDRYRFLTVNQAFLSVTGLDASQVVGKQVHEVIPEPSLTIDLGKYRQAAQEKTIVRWEETSDYPSGRLTGEVSVAPVFDESGNCTHLVGSVHDITERKRAEEQLYFQSSLVNNAPDAIIAMDTNWVIKSWNAAAEVMYGWSAQEAMGRRSTEMIQNEFVGVTNEETRRQLFGTGIWKGEVNHVRRDNVKIPVQVALSLVKDSQGKQVGYVTINRDISERKRVEQEQAAIYRISEAAQTSQSLDELYGSIHAIIGGLMPAKNFYIALYDAPAGVFRFPYHADERDSYAALEPIRPGKSLTGYVWRTGKALLATPEVFGQLQRSGEVGLVGAQMVDWLGVPLKVRQETIGVMAVQTYSEDVRLGEADRDILTFVSTQVAMTIERRQAEEQLYFQSSLVDNAPDAIIAMDENSVIKSWNAAAEVLYGWSAQEVIGHNPNEFIQNEFEGIAGDEVDRQLAETGTWKGELFQTRRGGVKIPVQGSVSVVKDSKGKQVGFVIIVRDITERRQAEEQLYFQSSLVDHASDAIIALATDETIKSWNGAAEVMYGWSAQEVVGHNLREFVHDEYVGITDEEADRQLKEAGIWKGELFQARRDGVKIPVQASVSLVKDRQGKTVGFVAINRDISERMRAEDALRESEERYRLLAETSPDMIFMVNPEGTVTYINSIAAHSVDRQPADIIGNRMEYFFPAEIAQRQLNNLHKVFENGRPLSLESISIFQGKMKWLDTWLVPIKDSGGTVVSVMGISRDVTEHKRAEEALLESEKRFHTLFEQAAVGVALLETRTGSYIDINQKFCDFLGYTKEEMLDLTFHAVTYADDVQENVDNNALLMAGKIKEFSIEKRYIRKDRSIVWGNLTVSPLWAPGEEPAEYFHIAVVQDITERKRAEEQLYFQSSLVDNASDAIIAMDTDWVIKSWNAAAEAMYGWSAQEVVGHNLREIIQDEYVGITEEEVDQLLAETGGWKGELNQVLVGGIKIPVQASVALVRDHRGKQVGYVTINRDISERKRAEQALTEGEERYRELFTGINSGVVVFDAQAGGVDFIIKEFNPAAERIEKIGREEVVGRRLTQVFPGIGEMGLLEVIRRVWQIGVPEHHPATLYKDNRGAGWRENYIYKLPSGEVVAVYEDVTEQKQAEEQIRMLNLDLEKRVSERTAELEAAVRELNAFSYSVSHDLRAPLRAIDGFSQILLEDYLAQMPPEAQRYLKLVVKNSQKMERLIEDMLLFSRTDRLPLVKRSIAPARLVREGLAELQRMQEGRQVEVLIGALPTCQADPNLLKQVFINLLSNAIKFTRQREKAVIEVGSRDENGQTIYYVKDNGAGFDMRYADKLFGVFQRLHSEEEFEGTGVGLSIVQRIIVRHGGRIWAQAEVDKGATFFFTLGQI